jgi:chemotaxis response regulator CheB
MAETIGSGQAPDETVSQEQVEPLSEQHSPEFPIVGIGASAGGLAAFEAFFSTMPADTILAWLLSWCSTWPATTRASFPN